MFARISNSWQLVKASWSVLLADKELLVFPIISMVGVIITMITFAIPAFGLGIFQALAGEGNVAAAGAEVLGLVLGFLFYLVTYFVVIFCNSALMGAAMIRLEGGDPTVRDGFRIASQHLVSILGYAAISATVGMILRAISERGGIVGQIVSSLLGFAWNVVTFLVIPVLVIEGVGPVEAIKRSGALLRETWGEQLIGNFGIGAVFGLLFLAVILLSVPLFVVAISSNSVVMIVAVVGLLILVLAGLGLISSALNGIYAVAVYRYAEKGQAGEFFNDELVRGAFRHK